MRKKEDINILRIFNRNRPRDSSILFRPITLSKEIDQASIDAFIMDFRRRAGLGPQDHVSSRDFGKVIPTYEGLQPVALYNISGNHWTLLIASQGDQLELYDPLIGLRKGKYVDKVGLSPTLRYYTNKGVYIGLNAIQKDNYQLPKDPLENLGPIQTKERPTDCGPLALYAALVARNLQIGHFFPK